MNSIERNNPKPLYVQLEELIRNNIDTGIWKPQNAIPSESELSKEYDLSVWGTKRQQNCWILPLFRLLAVYRESCVFQRLRRLC